MNQEKSAQKLVRTELSPKSQQRHTNATNTSNFKSYWETDTGKTAEAPAPTYVHCPKCCKDMSYVTTSY